MKNIKAAPMIETLCSYSAYPELIKKILRLPGAFFLDGAERVFDHSRYSFLGTDPFLMYTCTGNDITLTGDGISERVQSDPFEYVKKILGRYAIESRGDLPPFLGGAEHGPRRWPPDGAGAFGNDDRPGDE